MSALARCLTTRLFPLTLLAALMLSACHVTPYQRTLPEWVQRVNVPMVVNHTSEPGLEELVTKAFQAEILADGRLELTGKDKANVVLKVTLHSYAEKSSGFESDDVERDRDMKLEVGLALFDPKDMINPIGHIDRFTVDVRYNSDYRAYSSELAVDAKERLGETTALRLFAALMSNVKFVK